MNVYIAASPLIAERAHRLLHILQKRGVDHDYDWTDHLPTRRGAPATAAIRRAVEACDLFVVLLPHGGDALIEIGMALQARRPIFIAGAQTDLDELRSIHFQDDLVAKIIDTSDGGIVTAITEFLRQLTDERGPGAS